MVSIEKVDGENYTGALINKNRVAIFNSTEMPLSTIQYQVSSSQDVLHIITGIKEGQFTIWQNGNRIQSADVSSDGVVFFTSKGGGEFVVKE